MATTCKGIVFPKPNVVEVQALELPDIGPADIGVRTLYSGISAGTELWGLRNKFSGTKFPLVTGYQKTGIVEKVGANVTTFKPGDVVFLGTTKLTTDIHTQWAGHTSYSVIDADNDWLFKLPDGLDPKLASPLVLSATGYHGAAEVMPIEAGESVAVIGVGMVGQFSAQVARARGATVVAVDVIDDRLALAAKLANAIAINPTKQNAAEVIKAHFPDGLDAVIDTSAQARAVNSSFGYLKNKGGRYCFQGYYPDQTAIEFYTPHVKELTMYNPCSVTRTGLQQCAQHFADGSMHVEPLITHTAPVEQAPEMYDMLLNNPKDAIGVVIDWREG